MDQVGLKFMILLLQPPKCRDYRPAPHLDSAVLIRLMFLTIGHTDETQTALN
jgi:hypothetical protein